MDKTTNLALSQWAASDRVTRADFNSDNSKIDAAVGALRTADTTMQGSISTLQGSVSSLQTAVAGKCSVIVGTYTGDGAESRTITLGVTPKAVLVFMEQGFTYYANCAYSAFAVAGAPARFSATYLILAIVNGGFTAYQGTGAYMNGKSLKYLYAALY